MCKGIGEIEAIIRTKKFEESSKDFRKIYRYLIIRKKPANGSENN